MLDEINLVEITSNSVYHNFPKFFQENTQFYLLEHETDEHKAEEVGFMVSHQLIITFVKFLSMCFANFDLSSLTKKF